MRLEERTKPWTDEEEAEKERANRMAQIFFKKYQNSNNDIEFDIATFNLNRYLELENSKRERSFLNNLMCTDRID